MAFDFDQRFDRPEDDGRKVGQLKGEDLRKVLRSWEASLSDLISGKQRKKLEAHGFVVLMNGSWGSGKTTATRALIKGVQAKCKNERELQLIEYSFLPFGNVNESIADFINELAGKLWQENWLDMRNEVKHLIASATPADDTKYKLGLNTGLFTAGLERGWRQQTFIDGEKKLSSRFKSLSKKKRTVVVTIDDVDRLQPNEVVAILRLTEKLRRLPNLLIIMPMHKTIVANAVRRRLKLPRQVDAQTFLRKATDAEFSINNSLTTLKRVFLEGWEHVDQNDELLELIQKDSAAIHSEALQDDNGKNVSDLCWYTLLHVLILEAAIKDIEENSSGGEGNAVARVFSPDYSEYLSGIKDLFGESRSKKAYIYPVSNNLEDAHDPNKRIPRILAAGGSEEYQPLTEHGMGSVPQHLKLLARTVAYNDKWTYADDSLEDRIKREGTVDNKGEYDSSARYILFDLFIPRLISTNYEPFITDNLHGYYKLRDIKELSKNIRSRLLEVHQEDRKKKHYNVVKLVFKVVRQSYEDFER